METSSLNDTINKNFGLTKEAFDQLVKNLQLGDDQLFEHIYLAHFEKCVRYLINRCGADDESAYSSTMDALLEIREDLIHGKIEYGNLAFYYTRRARMKFSKRGKSFGLSITPDENISDPADITQEMISKETVNLVGRALNKLGEDCRNLIKLYYLYDLNWPQIADIYNPGAAEKTLVTKTNTLKRRTSRKCLPAFKDILKKLM